MTLGSCEGMQFPMDPLAGNGPVSGGMAHLWQKCRQVEADRKRLEIELKAEKNARSAERLGLLARLRVATGQAEPMVPVLAPSIDANTSCSDLPLTTGLVDASTSFCGLADAAALPSPAIHNTVDRGCATSQSLLGPAVDQCCATSQSLLGPGVDQCCATSQSLLGPSPSPGPQWEMVLEAACLAAAEGAEVVKHCSAQQSCASSAERAARRLAGRLEALICLCADHQAGNGATAPDLQASVVVTAATESMPSETVPIVSTQCPLLKEGPAGPPVVTWSTPVSPIGAVFGSPAAEKDVHATSRSSSPLAWWRGAEGASPSPLRHLSHVSDGSPAKADVTVEETPRVLSCSPSSASTLPKPATSFTFSSPLALSLLMPLTEAKTICSHSPGASLRARSLSYSGDALSIAKVATVGSRSDDVKLHQFQRCMPSLGTSGRPRSQPKGDAHGVPVSRGPPRGGRQPRRLRLEVEVDSMHRLPDFVSRRLRKAARSPSTGAQEYGC